MFNCRILKDSINPKGIRLTTFEITLPRIVLAEFNTHRAFSRNAASSRAIPVQKMIDAVIEDPFIPIHWGKNQKGMQAYEVLSDKEARIAEKIWLKQRDNAVDAVRRLSIPEYHVNRTGYIKKDEHVTDYSLDVHKQIANRLLESHMWSTVIVTGTEQAYENFFALRNEESAEPHIRHISRMMIPEYINSKPKRLKTNEWHLPLIFDEDLTLVKKGEITFDDLIKVCVGRCARVSYLTHDGRRDLKADIELHDRLLVSGHWSAFEHAAKSTNSKKVFGNFKGWNQYRKMFSNEVRSYNFEEFDGTRN